MLINNAGVGVYGDFVDTVWERKLQMLQLDMITLTHLTKLFVRHMVGRDFGYILLVASVLGHQPTPGYSTVGAAKGYVLDFGIALNHELRKTNVSCTVISPGFVATEFYTKAGRDLSFVQRMMTMKSASVARKGIKAMLRRRSSTVPG